MRSRIIGQRSKAIALAVALVGALATVSTPHAQSISADQTTQGVRRALERLPYYGVFDYLAFSVDRGTATLKGYAYHGDLKSAAESAVRKVSGVDDITNEVEMLPVSQNDDRIRWATFYRIYTDAFLSRYAPGGGHFVLRDIYYSRRFPGMQPVGSYGIHIIVKGGRTTLLGIVDTQSDKVVAEMRAREVTGVFGVENELRVAGTD